MSSVNSSGVALSFAADPIDGQRLDEPDMRSVVRSVAMKPNVSSLKLQGNVLTSASVLLLSNYLQQTTSLRSLDVSMCGLGDIFSTSIVKAACHQSVKRPVPPVSFIDLSLNHITATGAQSIAKTLRFHAAGTVKSLAMKYNPLTAAGLLAILRVNNGLTELDARYSFLLESDGSVELLAQGVREDRSLRSLLLDGCGLSTHQQQLVLEALHGNRKSRLSVQTLTFGKTSVGGPASTKYRALDAFVQSSCNGALSPEMLDEVQALDGGSAVVRGRVRAMPVPEARVQRGCSRTRKAVVECVEVSQGAYERSASARRSSSTHRHVDPSFAPREEITSAHADEPSIVSGEKPSLVSTRIGGSPSKNHRCAKAPTIGRLAESERQNELVLDREREILREMQSDQEGAPLSESIVPVRGRSRSCRSANHNRSVSAGSSTSVRSTLSSGGNNRSTSIGASSRSQPPLQLSKGQTAKMLLDRAMVSDEQCAEILNVLVDDLIQMPVEWMCDMPMELNDAPTQPSILNALEMTSIGRINGVAKILWLILHLPGNRVSMRRLNTMDDLPTYVAAAATETIAKYRSLRGVENRAAKELLERARLAQAPLPRPLSKKELSRVPSRYLARRAAGDGASAASNAATRGDSQAA